MKKSLLVVARTLRRACRPAWQLRSAGALAFTMLVFHMPAEAQEQTTYEAFAGGSYARALDTSSGNAYGWQVSVSQYPYEAHSWIGATIEGSGLFQTQADKADGVTLHESLYTCMAGPSFAVSLPHRMRPFARALVGAVVQRASESGQAASSYVSSEDFDDQTVLGAAVGGGVDLWMSQRLAVRGAADWLTYKESADNRINDVRASIGVVLKF